MRGLLLICDCLGPLHGLTSRWISSQHIYNLFVISCSVLTQSSQVQYLLYIYMQFYVLMYSPVLVFKYTSLK